eukprot:scaffold27282_cov45-Phaeocystis_antarctica.AAC.1
MARLLEVPRRLRLRARHVVPRAAAPQLVSLPHQPPVAAQVVARCARVGPLRGLLQAALDIGEPLRLGDVHRARCVQLQRLAVGHLLVVVILLQDGRVAAEWVVLGAAGQLLLAVAPLVGGEVDVLEQLVVIVHLVAIEDVLVGEREHHLLPGLEVVDRVRQLGARHLRLALHLLVHLVEAVGSAGGPRLALRLARRSVLAFLRLPTRLGHPRRRRVELLAAQLLAEGFARELLVEQALPARRVELLAQSLGLPQSFRGRMRDAGALHFFLDAGALFLVRDEVVEDNHGTQCGLGWATCSRSSSAIIVSTSSCAPRVFRRASRGPRRPCSTPPG